MRKRFSEIDIELLGYVDPKIDNENKYSILYSAHALAGLERITSRFLVLKPNCKVTDLEEFIKAKFTIKGKIYIVIPKSIKMTVETIKDLFGDNVYYHDDLIWSKLYSVFKNYLDSLKDTIITERHYVAPRIEGGDQKKRLDQEIMDFCKGRKLIDRGKVVVICADAGVGKTTLARYVTVELAQMSERTKVIPIYVEASHWGKIRLEDVEELWDVISNSIQSFSANLNITKNLFEYALAQGYLAFIFDGFDELCGHKRSFFRAKDVLKELIDITNESDAKIIITTRTLYWNSEIQGFGETDVTDNIKLYHLAPFNTPQAKDYFKKIFKTNKNLYDKAIGMYSTLISSNIPPTGGGSRAQFVNLPLCVSMIGTFVQQGGDNLSDTLSNKSLLQKIFYHICEREQHRKNLLTSASAQLEAFQRISVDMIDDYPPEFDLEDLELEGFESADIPRLIDHPLLTKSDGKLCFCYDFITPYLRAIYLNNSIIEKNDMWRKEIRYLMAKESNGKGYILEHLQDIMEMNEKSLTCISDYFNQIPDIPKASPEDIKTLQEAKGFLFHLTKIIVHKLFVTRKERSDALYQTLYPVTYLIDRTIHNIYFSGQIDNLDLSGIKFQLCHFTDTIFVNCSVDTNTTFNKCQFIKYLDFQNCSAKEWSCVKMQNSNFNPPTNLDWQNFIGVGLGNKEDILKDALELAFKKFWYYGRVRITIQKKDWGKGSLGHSSYCEPILTAMLREGLIEAIHISGVTEGGYGFNKDSLADLQRFMDNKQMTGKIKRVFNNLLKIIKLKFND